VLESAEVSGSLAEHRLYQTDLALLAVSSKSQPRE
jgi:hypothetical protein